MCFFVKKVGYNDLVLLVVTWSGKLHELMKFQSSGTYMYVKQDMKLI